MICSAHGGVLYVCRHKSDGIQPSRRFDFVTTKVLESEHFVATKAMELGDLLANSIAN